MVGGTRRISSALLNDVRSIQISGNRNKSTSNVVRIYIRALLFFLRMTIHCTALIASRTTNRKTAITDASSYLLYLKAVSYKWMSSVLLEFTGPPLVVTYTCSKVFAEKMISVIVTSMI